MPQRELELLDVDEIQSNLNTKKIGRKVLVFNSTSSTNDVARRYIGDKNCNGMAIFTEEQSAGRGRAGNKWFSKRSESILCSIIISDYDINTELLSLACAIAVADSIGRNAKIKWPNDILINGKKVAGILLEAIFTKDTYTYIIGIGINCHQNKTSFPDELRSVATSIDIENKTTCDRIGLAKRLLNSMEYWLKIAEKNSKTIIEYWCKLSIQLGHRITLSYNKKQFSGNCIGIDPEKGLILQLDSGGVRMFDAAHTSIIKN
ncbi:MAG: biotin--[acetyl-CoA-carboxylase] ligase [Sedimentisphaerales bacterium]|nr:biotin--[acetyl-CoA-carboxylase] ligase [Sedimentisphaerales bacterium]